MSRSIIRSIIAIIAGYLTMAIGVGVSLAIAATIIFDEAPDPTQPFEGPVFFLWVELALAAVAALGGGYVCAWIARENERKHGLVLAALVTILGGLSVAMEQGLKPLASSVGVVGVGLLGLWLGVEIRRRTRLSWSHSTQAT